MPSDPWIKAVHRQPDETGQYLEGMIRNRTAVWDVIVKEAHYGKESGLFLDALPLPRYLDPWVSADGLTFDNQCLARTVDIRRDTRKAFLRLTYNYSTMVTPSARGFGQLDPATSGGGGGPGHGGSGSAASPADLSPRISYGYESFEEALRRDFSAVPKWILNKAKRFPQPLPPGNKPILVITYERWEQYFPKVHFFNHGYTVNVDPWNGFNAGTVLHPPLTCGPRQEFGGVWWRNAQYVFKVHPLADGWDALLPSFDTHQLNAAGKPVPILDPITSQPTSEQWPLDAAGHVILDLVATPVATELFRIVERSNFDLLNVDLSGEWL